MRGQTTSAIRGYLEREGATGVLRERLLEEKTLEWLLENAELIHEELSAEVADTEESAGEE
jgi:hypothetical protein